MKRSLLRLLASPCCAAELEAELKWEGDEAESGELRCRACAKSYPVLEGVPRLFQASGLESGVVKTRERFAWEWDRYPGSLLEDKPLFLEETQLDENVLPGKLVLDVGCGMGRYAAVAHELGAEMVAFDLSDACLRLTSRSRASTRLHVVQGDIHHPPFKKGLFDVIYSQGVLHHTSDTRIAFDRAAELVKPGGLLTVWLYGKAGRFSEFATNPLKEGRQGLAQYRRLAWAVVGLRHLVSDLIRAFTVRLPLRAAYALCYPLAWLGALPAVKYLTFSVHRDFQVRLIENFDWISPPYQYHHTKEELAGWFAASGFSVLKILPHGLVPKPGVLGRKGNG